MLVALLWWHSSLETLLPGREYLHKMMLYGSNILYGTVGTPCVTIQVPCTPGVDLLYVQPAQLHRGPVGKGAHCYILALFT